MRFFPLNLLEVLCAYSDISLHVSLTKKIHTSPLPIRTRVNNRIYLSFLGSDECLLYLLSPLVADVFGKYGKIKQRNRLTENYKTSETRTYWRTRAFQGKEIEAQSHLHFQKCNSNFIFITPTNCIHFDFFNTLISLKHNAMKGNLLKWRLRR